MKCIKLNNTSEIKRVSNETAAISVEAGKATYIPKSEWKLTRKPPVLLTEEVKQSTETAEQRTARIARKADDKKRRQDKKNQHKNYMANKA